MDEFIENLPIREGEHVFEWLAHRYSTDANALEQCAGKTMPLLKLGRRVTKQLATEVDSTYKGRVALLLSKYDIRLSDRNSELA